MQQIYEVEFTEPAERAYTELFTKAQAQLEIGLSEHPAVVTFAAVENALNVTLPSNPCDSRVALAGLLASVYKLSLDSVSISYVVHPAKLAVIVLTICEAERCRTVRRWLNSAIDTGEVDGLMQTLGLNNPCAKVNVSSRLLH